MTEFNEEKLSGFADFEYAMVIVTGHGNKAGISSQSAGSIKPDAALAAVRKIPGLKAGIFVLGQCYAGVFNFLNTRTEPRLALMGATNLNYSFSTDTEINPPLRKENGGEELKWWNANNFIISFFQWLINPLDVDGDGRVTLMDAYKFSGAKANENLRKSKTDLFFEVNEQTQGFQAARQKVKDKQNPTPKEDLLIKALQREIKDNLEILHSHQEPWILGSDFARDISFHF